MLVKVKFLGHEIVYNTVKPIHSKVDALHKFPSPPSKVALTSFISALNFYTNFIEKLHIYLKPFYDLLHGNTPWSWTTEHEALFHKLKTLSLLIRNLQYLIQNILFSLLLMPQKLD